MKIITKELPKNHDLVLFGDTHEGTVLQHKSGVQQCKDFIMAKRSRYAFNMGDVAEWRKVDHPYYDPATHNIPIPLAQRDAVIADFKPIKNRIIGILEGNHEYGLQRFGNMTEEVCAGLSDGRHEVIAGTITSVLNVVDHNGDTQYKTYLTHGNGSLTSQAKDYEQQEANKKASLKMKLKDLMGDCVIMACGHFHQLIVVPPSPRLYLTVDEKIKQNYLGIDQNNNYINPDQRVYFCTGSFLRTFALGVSGYAERKMYKPVELGFINIEVRDGKINNYHKVVV